MSKLKSYLMKILTYSPIFLLFASLMFYIGCTEKEQVSKLPDFSITYPVEGEEIPLGDTVRVSVEANDDEGNILSVRLFIDDKDMGYVNSLPYDFEWYTVHEDFGNHNIKILVIDNLKQSVTKEIGIVLTKGMFNTVTDIDGNIYKTVIIGNQVWMTANLKVTKTSNGEDLSLITDNYDWWNLGSNYPTAYCYYNNNTNGEKDTYGALYTYDAAKNACPTGWHLPSEEDWVDLETYIEDHGYADNPAMVLKATSGWKYNNNGTDNYGFSAKPGGARMAEDGKFDYDSLMGVWWTSTEYNDYKAYYRALNGFSTSMMKNYHVGKSYGFSVRCIKDDY